MAYGKYERPAQDENGNLLENVYCHVRLEDLPGNPDASLFSDRDGAVPIANPFLFTDGKIRFFAAGGPLWVNIYKAGYDVDYRYEQIGLGAESDLTFVRGGSFTPTFVATGCTFSYAAQEGRWSRAGDLVTARFKIQLNTSGNTLAANGLSISGLPFAVAAGADTSAQVEFAAATTSYVQMSVFAAGGGSVLQVKGLTAAGVTNSTQINANAALHATNGSVIVGTISYHTDAA